MAGNGDYDQIGATEMTLEELVTTNPLPQRAKVTVGYEDPCNEENSFSNGDVIEARCILCPFVALTYVDSRRRGEVRVTVPTNNPTRFRFPAPATSRPRVFNTVKQLVKAWPMVVVARSDHNDRNPAFTAGDRLRLIRLDRSRGDGGKTPVLELKNLNTLELVRLPFTCVATFAEAADRRLYTLGELAQIARVPRQLVLRHEDRDIPEAWIAGVPLDYSGYVQVDKPQYLVEVQAVAVEETGNVDTHRFVVSIDSDITVVVCEADYVSVSGREFYLHHLANKPPGVFPRIVGVLSWKEETTVLQNHFVRPGDQLVLYSLVTVRKLAVSAGRRRFFVPLHHPDMFSAVRGANPTPRRLHELVSTSTKFPLMLEFTEHGNYISFNEDTLPRRTALKAEMIVEERCVVAAKIDLGGHRLQPAFRLPLRTKIELHFYGRWKKPQVPPIFSCWDCMAEEVSKPVYYAVTGSQWSGKSNRETVDFTARRTTETDVAPRRQSTMSASDATSALGSDKPPPVFARSRSVPSTRHEHRRPPPPPPPSPSPPLTQPDNADVDDYESPASDDDYEKIDDGGNLSPVKQTELLEIPVDGNVSRFKVEQVQQLLQQLRVPAGTLTEWSRLKVDGRAFAEMTDSQLAKYNVAIPLVMYFRDRSRLDVLTRL